MFNIFIIYMVIAILWGPIYTYGVSRTNPQWEQIKTDKAYKNGVILRVLILGAITWPYTMYDFVSYFIKRGASK